MLKIYNTLTNKKENFIPINYNKVGMYVCGITAYDLCHIGHARTFIAFDIIYRYLKFKGYLVTYVRNITDIDDKIINKSLYNNESYIDLTNRMIVEMYKDFDKLNICRPDYEPRATEFIDINIKLIKKFIKNGNGYISSNGDVMFSVKSNNKYGILSNQVLKKLKSNFNIYNSNDKKSLFDFVLWKKSKIGEPSWASPWGYGRPGWHIECSSMSTKYLGKYFDIHGGGSDLIFPHHENEIAQSTSYYNTPYVNIWMHSGMIMYNSKKISKSLNNNNIILRNIFNKFNPEYLRFFLISKHYRSQFIYNDIIFQQSNINLKKLYISLLNTDKNFKSFGGDYFIKKFIFNMNNDFNTPKACYILFKIANKINVLKKKNNIYLVNGLASTLRKLGNILGILQQDPLSFLQKKNKINIKKNKKINFLIKKRNFARKIKNWKQADIIRNYLLKNNIILEDNNETTIWYYK